MDGNRPHLRQAPLWMPFAALIELLLNAQLTTKLRLVRAFAATFIVAGLAFVVGGAVAGRAVFIVGGLLVIGFGFLSTLIPGISERRRAYEHTRDEAARAEARRHLGRD